MKKWVKRALAGVVATACLSFGMSARAMSIELFLTGHTVVAGNTDYQYNVFLTPGNYIQGGSPNDLFVVYDVAGLVSESKSLVNNASWTITTPLITSPQPQSQSAPDNGSIPNIVFTYTGSQVDNPVSPGTNMLLGTIDIVSTVPFLSTNILTYSSQDHNDITGVQGGNTFTVQGPSAAPLPSTASMGLTMIAACGIAGAAMKLRRKEVVA